MATSNITARVTSASGSLRTKIEDQKDLKLRSALASREINTLDDIDVTNLRDGSVLIYSSSNAKWEASNLLEKQTVECGQY